MLTRFLVLSCWQVIIEPLRALIDSQVEDMRRRGIWVKKLLSVEDAEAAKPLEKGARDQLLQIWEHSKKT
jgi:superfamily II DNA helicase RecQ